MTDDTDDDRNPPDDNDPDPEAVNADLLDTVRRMRTIRLPRRQALEVLTNASCGDLGSLESARDGKQAHDEGRTGAVLARPSRFIRTRFCGLALLGEGR